MEKTSPLVAVALLIRIGVACVFLYAGMMKLYHLPEFAVAVSNYELLSPIWIIGVTLYLPCFEIIVALGLLSRRYRMGALVWLILLLLLFFGVLVSSIVRGLDIECGCNGIGSASTPAAILRDFILLGCCLFLLFLQKNKGTYPSFL